MRELVAEGLPGPDAVIAMGERADARRETSEIG
jgi:hypothetical protein